MKKLLIICVLLLGLLIPSLAGAAADVVSVTRTKVTQPSSSARGIDKITYTFSSTDADAERAAARSIASVFGTIVKFHYIPGAVNTPDAGADIRVYSALTGGIDLLFSACDNVGATETVGFPAHATTLRPAFMAGDTLYFSATDLGAGTNDGVLYVWILSP